LRHGVPIIVACTFAVALGAACERRAQGTDAAPSAVTHLPSSATAVASEVQIVSTSLDPSACRQDTDPADPNSMPFRICPGVEGYELIVRRVESGRISIDVVDPARRRHPLDFANTVTRHRSGIGGRAEWHVTGNAGRRTPVAVIVPVQSLESDDDPAQVTRTILAVAKLTPETACVVDRPDDGTPAATTARAAASTAPTRPCAADLKR
jgi:hypothetical protein